MPRSKASKADALKQLFRSLVEDHVQGVQTALSDCAEYFPRYAKRQGGLICAPLFLSVGHGRYSVPLKRGTATCLHVASAAGSRHVVWWLVCAGASVHAKDGHQNSALAVAQTDEVATLLSKAALPTAIPHQAYTTTLQRSRDVSPMSTGHGAPYAPRGGAVSGTRSKHALLVVASPVSSPTVGPMAVRRREAWLGQRRQQVRMHYRQ